MKNLLRLNRLYLALLALTLVSALGLATFQVQAQTSNFADLCANADGIAWNKENPIPAEKPCANPGKWVAVAFWKEGGTIPESYQTRRFQEFDDFLKESTFFSGGIYWFEPEYADLCSNRNGFIWNSDNPLRENPPCINNGKWVAVSFWNEENPGENYTTQRFEDYSDFNNEAKMYAGGIYWFEPDFTNFCSNTDGFRWNSDNPLPMKNPCGNGRITAVAFWEPSSPAENYTTRYFNNYNDLLVESKNYSGGTIWWEHQLFLPLVAR